MAALTLESLVARIEPLTTMVDTWVGESRVFTDLACRSNVRLLRR